MMRSHVTDDRQGVRDTGFLPHGERARSSADGALRMNAQTPDSPVTIRESSPNATIDRLKVRELNVER
jgi:hypothetical protein